ncbi:MAG: sulfotransferase family protein [Actinomycetota bacterium]
MTDRRKIVFVGGYGRSGSTLLDRVLGHCSDRFFSGGEIRHIWQEGFVENRVCGCGRPFDSCEFWRAVSERSFGGPRALDVDELIELKNRVDRWWLIPRIAARRPGPRFEAHLARYQDHLRRLYEGVGAESGADVIIDSTKDPSHGYVLSSMRDIDLRVIHLVRDSRAVAHSWRRKKYNPGSGTDMNRYNLLKTGTEWSAINALIGGLARRSSAYVLVRYEDLVADPASELRRILAAIDEEATVPTGGRVRFRDDHTVAGNPIRFKRGETQLCLDDEWRSGMKLSDKFAMTSLTLPGLTRYGFAPSWVA